MPLISINPSTGEVIREFRSWSPDEIHRVLKDVHAAWTSWKDVDLSGRTRYMTMLAKELRSRREDLARTITTEMGKPIVEARAEIEKCAVACDYAAEHTGDFLRPDVIVSDASSSYVRFDPLGVILAIMPWNFPFWQVFRFAASAIMAGNTVVLKHASNTSWCSLSIEGLFGQAGFPDNVFRSVLAGSALVADIIRNPAISAITLTGSSEAGRSVAETAGHAVKKTVLELGGSDPFIVLPDADLDFAAEQATLSRTLNCGQSCIAAKRFIVDASVMEPFLQRFVHQMSSRVVGDPLSDSTQMGPMARTDLRDQLHGQVQESVRKGARLVLGGELPDGPGAWYPPTILADVVPGMPASDDEMFGPVASVMVANGVDEAIERANETPFGLGASLWTRDTALAERLARRIQAGSVYINGFVKSDPRLPFGGIKESGYGRELSVYGIREFVNIKTVWIR